MFKKLIITTSFASSVATIFFASNASAEDAAYQQAMCPDTYYAAREASCKQASQQIYAANTADCKYYAGGGAAVGAGGLGYAAYAVAAGGPYGLAALLIGAAGTGVGVFGSSSCYNDATVMRDLNVTSCELSTANLKAACYQSHTQEPQGSSSASAGSGDGTNLGKTDTSKYNKSGNNGYSPLQPRKKIGIVDIW